MIRVATAITTAPRPRPTLVDSLASYRSAGFGNDVLILSDGPLSGVPDDRVTIVENVPVRGCTQNWARALDVLASLTSEDYLLILQDDVTWCPDALYRLNSMPDAPACSSLFLPRRVSRYLRKTLGQDTLQAGWLPSDMGWETWGAQAFMFHREAANRLLRDDQFREYCLTHSKNVDRIVPKCLLDMGYRIYYKNPCLVHHSAGSGNSSLRDKPVQPMLETDHFAGDLCDA